MTSAATVSAPLAGIIAEACAALERSAADHLGAPGPCRAEVVTVTPRTHSTDTIIRLSSGDLSKRFRLKTLVSSAEMREIKRSQIATEFRLLTDLGARFRPHPLLGVITPVECWPEQLSMLTEEFPGRTLEAALAEAKIFRPRLATDAMMPLCHRVGRWLRLFQEFTTPEVERRFDLSELLAYCERRLRLLGRTAASGVDDRLAVSLSARLERLASATAPADLLVVGRHNDFRPDNILTDGQRIIVLDFTGFTHGPALYDLVKFWMKLDDYRFGPLFSDRAVDDWQAAVVEGYGRPLDTSAPLFTLLRLANILDKMSEIVAHEAAPPALSRRLVQRRWYRARLRAIRDAVAPPVGGAR